MRRCRHLILASVLVAFTVSATTCAQQDDDFSDLTPENNERIDDFSDLTPEEDGGLGQ